MSAALASSPGAGVGVAAGGLLAACGAGAGATGAGAPAVPGALTWRGSQVKTATASSTITASAIATQGECLRSRGAACVSARWFAGACGASNGVGWTGLLGEGMSVGVVA